ncbi:hypothetical protein SDC9_07333 [bioreactor metagenome]|uniref:PD-(D/E)XK endonuclease-like domain-containing protein n=1 Tax=bioreactor metagenome TaxID=1076179 RepID=A0A644T4A4_9ZZZZ|nr:phage protein [Dehalococcoides mccartyi]
MGKHALLSASSSHRWLNCPPSARLCEQYEDKGSDYAAEGTEAHTLGEYRLKTALCIKVKDPTKTLQRYSEEMDECATGYASYILELVETAKQTCADPVVLIEQKLDFSKYVQEGFGTGDCVIIADGTLHIVDYKHGQGVLVEAADNPQMKLYALGALELFDGIYDINEVSMTIYQPRRDNISTHTVFKESLYQWAEEVLKPTAEIAYAGDGEYNCGEWCQFCKAKYECRKRAERNMELAKLDFKRPPLLEDDEIESILGKIDDLISWASDIRDYALQAALGGKLWQGWKVVEGKSNRKYVNEDAVAKAVATEGYDPYEHKVMGITAMEKALGKAKFAELLNGLVEKPQGKPTLVPEGDKRPAINTAKNDFMEVKDNG